MNGWREPSSPELTAPLTGYSSEVAVTAGQTLDLMVSGAGSARLSVVRLLHGDPSPAGPGYRDDPVAWTVPAAVELTEQPLDLGSFLEVPLGSVEAFPRGFTLGLWISPTLLTGGWQAIAARGTAGKLAFGLFAGGDGMLAGAISRDGAGLEWCTAHVHLEPDSWQFVALVLDAAAGEIGVHQYSPHVTSELEHPTRPPELASSFKTVGAGVSPVSHAPLVFGALPRPDGDGHWAHFNGKIAAPWLLSEALTARELEHLKDEPVGWPHRSLVGAWDLSRDVSTARVPDVSGHERHGVLRNSPTRAVTGPRWTGRTATLYTDDPGAYDAVHLHDDDLADAAWPAVVELEVPPDARPGIYAAVVSTDHDRLTVPFVVSPPSPRADLCFVAPTLTWQAYGSNRGPYRFTEDGVLDQALCLYDLHSDGSVVNYCTRRKPTRSGNPSEAIRQCGAHTLPADLYLVDWLETTGQDYDVLGDQHLHGSADALLSYRCVILGAHPEYWTSQMLDALDLYIASGGRVMYLGGNGLYWVASLDPERPYIMEVRKSGDGDFGPGSLLEPGAMQHSTTLEVGGLWARRGRPPRRLLGVEHSANVFVQADGRWGFERRPESYDPRYRFVFEGVTEEVIGNFGLNLGTAAGFEMDSVGEWCWPDDAQPTVLARASHDSFMSPKRMPVPRVADIALIASPNGSAVFSAGSVTWTGSLCHHQYDNNVATITGNVLRRFLHVPRGHPVLDVDPV